MVINAKSDKKYAKIMKIPPKRGGIFVLRMLNYDSNKMPGGSKK